MTFTTSTASLWAAIESDLEKQEDELATYERLIEAYLGQDMAPTNHTYEFSTLTAPQIAFQNAKVNVKSRVPGLWSQYQVGIRYSLEVVQQDQETSSVLEQVCIESFFWRGVTMVSVELDHARTFSDDSYCVGFTHNEDGSMRPGEVSLDEGEALTTSRPGKRARVPVISRIDPKDFVQDGSGKGEKTLRRMGHRYYKGRQELLALARMEKGWNKESIDRGATAVYEAATGESFNEDTNDTMLEVWCVWVPHYYPNTPEGKKAKGDRRYHGSIFTIMGGEDGGLELREPRPFFGPKTGPYQVYGGVPIPSSSKRLAPLMASDNQRRARVTAGKALVRAIRNYKSAILAQNNTVAARIRAIGSGSVGSLGISSKMPVQHAVSEFNWGGPTAQLITAVEFFTSNEEETSGTSQNKKGLLTGGTATESAIASEAGALRLAMHKGNFQGNTGKMLSAVAWYIWHDPKIMVPLPPEAAEELGIDPAVLPEGTGLMYQGGSGEKLEKKGTVFEDLAIEIEPYSMERTSEGLQMKRVQESIELGLTIAKAAVEAPGAINDVPGLIDHAAGQLNLPGLGKFFGTPDPADDEPSKPSAPTGAAPAIAPVSGTPMPGTAAGAEAAKQLGVA